jgi:hypothetical protein
MDIATVWNLKPEWLGGPLAQEEEKYQGKGNLW